MPPFPSALKERKGQNQQCRDAFCLLLPRTTIHAHENMKTLDRKVSSNGCTKQWESLQYCPTNKTCDGRATQLTNDIHGLTVVVGTLDTSTVAMETVFIG